MQVAQGMLSVVADVLTPSEEHFEWVLLCEQQQQVAGAGGGWRKAACFWFSTLIFVSHESCYVLS